MNRLSPELYDNIYDLVFTAKPGKRTIDEHYRSPGLLHVSSATRRKYSVTYYAGYGVLPSDDGWVDFVTKAGFIGKSPVYLTDIAADKVRVIRSALKKNPRSRVCLGTRSMDDKGSIMLHILARIVEAMMTRRGVAGMVRITESYVYGPPTRWRYSFHPEDEDRKCSYRAGASSDDLRRHMDRLPQELYDNIYNLVFTVEAAKHTINHRYKTPHLLWIDRASRKRYAATYYGKGSTFKPPPDEGYVSHEYPTQAVHAALQDLHEYMNSDHRDDATQGSSVACHVGTSGSYMFMHVVARIMEAGLPDFALAGTTRVVKGGYDETGSPKWKIEFEPEQNGNVHVG